MSTAERIRLIPPSDAELERTLADAYAGVHDPKKTKSSRARMDRMREENRQLFGDADIGVEIIREMRDAR